MTEPVATSAKGYTFDSTPGWWWQDLDGEETPELVWPKSTFVYDRMRRTDSQVISVLRAVTLPIRRTGWRIDPNGAEPAVVQLVAQDLGLPVVGQDAQVPPRRTKGRFSWKHHLYQALLMLAFGHSYFEQVYRIEGAGSNARARLRKLEWRPPTTISKVNVARDGGLKSIEQQATIGGDGPIEIEVERLVAYVNEREGGNWLGKSLLRPAYKDWLIKERLTRTRAQTAIRNGMGVPVYEASEPPEGLGSAEMKAYIDEEIKAGLAIAQALQAGEDAGVSTPHGAKLTLQGVTGTLPDIGATIRDHDDQIARAVLAHFLNLGGDKSTGSYALGDTFESFFLLALQTVGEDIQDVAQQHIVEDLVDLNFGEDAVTPRLVFDEIGSRHPATAQAIQMLMTSGALSADPALERHLRTQYGLPDRDETAPAAADPQAAAFRQLAAAIAAQIASTQTDDERSSS